MHGTLVVNSWVSIHDGCEITYNVNDSDSAQFTVSGTAQSFEFFCQAEALRRFIEQGVTALAEMDVLAAKEEAKEGTREQTELGHAEERSA